jgi:hypothetical protein
MEAAAIASRWLITIGLVMVAIGLLWPWLGKLGLGGLSGDIAIERRCFAFYFAIVTCLIASIILSFIFWPMNLTLIVARRRERFGHRLREA